jgi:biopolymer transport protein ExbD
LIDFDLEQDLTAGSSGAGGTGPDLTPMIDMVFILLIFFLLTSVFILPAIDVELPGAATGEKPEELELTISLKTDGTIFVNKEQIPRDRLPAYLRQKAEEYRVQEVYLQADKALPFGEIVDVLDVTREVGFDSVSFMVEPR